jgi:hypothetical protein
MLGQITAFPGGVRRSHVDLNQQHNSQRSPRLELEQEQEPALEQEDSQCQE